jgi:hypothetical protein
MSLAPDDDAILYNAACALALLGEEERALDVLHRAAEVISPEEIGSRATLIGNDSVITRAFKR